MKKRQSNDSLPQKSDYDINDHLIKGKQKLWKKIIEWIFTILGWFIMLSYIAYVVYGMIARKNGWTLLEFGIYNRHMLEEVHTYYLILLIVFIVSIIVMILWKRHNQIKYGSLHRREFPTPVTKEELKETFELDDLTLHRLRHDRIVILPENIIPDHLGIGRGKKPTNESEKQ